MPSDIILLEVEPPPDAGPVSRSSFAGGWPDADAAAWRFALRAMRSASISAQERAARDMWTRRPVAAAREAVEEAEREDERRMRQKRMGESEEGERQA